MEVLKSSVVDNAVKEVIDNLLKEGETIRVKDLVGLTICKMSNVVTIDTLSIIEESVLRQIHGNEYRINRGRNGGVSKV